MTGERAIGPVLPANSAQWRVWLRDAVLPYWLERIASEPAGFVESLTADGKPDRVAAKTPLVTARLVYVFSHASLLGLSEAATGAAERGFRFLIERCWDAGQGGFFHEIDAGGAPLDPRKDAYDHAFALFAMAWLHRATGRREPLDWAARTIGYMDERLADPRAGGYREHCIDIEARPQPLPRRQNPHMHLLEACHALYEASGDQAWLERAERLVELFLGRFLDRETGTLGEFFTENWRPAPGEAGDRREPGHHFEWVWLLHHHARLSGRTDILEPADRLYRFAMEWGIDRAPSFPGAAFDALDRHGRIIDDGKLLWPQTEAIKAHLARWEFLGDAEAGRRASAHADLLFRRYLIDATARWRNRLSRGGRDIAPQLPVRVLYHLFLCFAELMRLWDTLPAAAPCYAEPARIPT